MSRVRLLFVWLMLLALPLQGIAAVSMLYCELGSHHTATQNLHGQASDHHAVAGPEAGMDPASMAHGADWVADAEGPAHTTPSPDLNHSCSACAACCPGIAIAELPAFLRVYVPPYYLQTSALPFTTLAPSVLDKPPRA